MRQRAQKGPLSVHAIAGSYVVLLGINMEEASSQGVLGFAIQRTDHTNNNKTDWLDGFKTFPGVQAPKNHLMPTCSQPVQSFFWSDFTTRRAHQYTYRIVAMRGTPEHLTESEDVSVTIDMEDEDKGSHSVYFNRGVAGSQAYARKFGKKKPEQVPDNAAWIWLSRGLEEALLAFIAQAQGKQYGLRAAFYEFQHSPVLDALKVASATGADVKIIYDARKNDDDYPNARNREAIELAELGALTIPRLASPSYIAHNKFMVLLENGKPTQVWTGSTNITASGIFGQSNVGHLVRDPKVAAKYLRYWNQLYHDPTAKVLRPWNDKATRVPANLPQPNSCTAIFSPRGSLEALEWYAKRMDKSKSAVFFTAAFGVNDLFQQVLAEHKEYLRYVLMEKEDEDTPLICKEANNLIAAGCALEHGAFGQWVSEQVVPGLSTHVKYIHTKYMLIDPLSDDPLVISGSANFSEPSTKNNDENMLIIRGDKRVADIYLSEFMRLFNHYYFRYILTHFKKPDTVTGKKGYLATDDSWREPFYSAGTTKYLERLYFA